jgi:hypothetical protein
MGSILSTVTESGDLDNRIMYSNAQRAALSDALIAGALGDMDLCGVAVCGSMAVAREDIWSDIDLVLAVTDASRLGETVAHWTRRMVQEHDAVHHVDIANGPRVYRAFLLPSTLEVDLNFVPAGEFRPEGPKFRALRGSPLPLAPTAVADSSEHFIGMGWLYAQQARACLGRGRLWQAERMIAQVRDQALFLACLRHGLPARYGSAIDSLPPSLLTAFDDSLVRCIEADEARRAYGFAVTRLCAEAQQAGRPADDRVTAALMALASTSASVPDP